jgi:hypothetical protein
VPRKLICFLAGLVLAAPAIAQQSDQTAPQPQVKVNVLNVCTPSVDEQKEIASALARIPKKPLFSTDFEVSRGRSTLNGPPNFLQPGQNTQASDEPSVASYVRIRREFSVQAMFASVQYSFSNDGQNMVETLVLHVRDPKDLIQVSLEDSASAIGSAAGMLAASTPVSRVRLERFGKSSIGLARCTGSENGPAPDQAAYEPLFRSASGVLNDYRDLLDVKRMVPEELARVSATTGTKPAAQTKPAKNSAAKK